MSGVIVNYNNNALTSMSSSGTKTLLTSGKYCEGNFEVVYSEPTTSSLTVTPTESQQIFNATGVYGYKPITVEAVPSASINVGVSSGFTDSFGERGWRYQAYYNTTSAGWVNSGIVTSTMSVLRAISSGTTITPTTTNKTVGGANWMMESAITVLGDPNLVASNIADGVSIFGVNGTHQGGGNDFLVTLSQNAYGSLTIDKTFSEIISACKAGKKIAAYGDGSPYYTGAIDVDDEEFNFVEVFGYSYSGNDYLVICEDDYTLESNFSAFVSTKYYYHPDNMNATPSDVASGKRFINWSGFQVGTATGGGGFTADEIAMRTISGDISGNATRVRNYAFYDCTALTTASFPNATSIGIFAFYNCTSLTTVSFPNVTSIGSSAFFSCHSLTTVSFPSATSIGSYAFQYCSSLTTASFPNVTIIGANAFSNCSALTTISFPNATSIGNSAFYSCRALTTASFPSVTSIGNSAFYSCRALTTASFPSVTTIGNNAFQYCYKLLSFYLLGSSVPTLGTSVFRSTPIDGYTTSTGGIYGSIFVPSSLYNQYIAATNWSNYAARIVSV